MVSPPVVWTSSRRCDPLAIVTTIGSPMKLFALAFLLISAADERSLGIGLDVLPEAFGVAAGRVRFAADLRLSACDAGGCRWDLGDGVLIVASLADRDGGLGLQRIEANLTGATSSQIAATRYQDACLTIVALLDPSGSVTDRRVTAAEIAQSQARDPNVEIERPDLGVTFYGVRSTQKTLVLAKCGAVADAR